MNPMNGKYLWQYPSPIGLLTLTETDGALSHLLFGEDRPLPGFIRQETPFLQKTRQQLEEYFAGSRTEFDLPLFYRGTPFQQAAWDALRTIPYGETRSYKDMAVQIGNPKAVRAVGMANNRNPISIIVPCHRVIGANGKLVGYGGGLPIKEKLLELERGHGRS